LGWVLYVTVQEPASLRACGVTVREPAIWSAAALLGLALMFEARSSAPSRATPRLAANLLLLAGLSAATWLLSCVLSLAVDGESACLQHAGVGGWFLLALAPVAASAAARTASDRSQVVIQNTLTTIMAGPSLAILASVWSASPAVDQRIAAGGWSICASLLLMIGAGADGSWRPVASHRP
jgi:hypothetical protein